MGNNTSKFGLSKHIDMPTLYSYLIIFERELKSKAGNFYIDAQTIILFGKTNNIKVINSLSKAEFNKKDKYDNYMFFNSSPNQVSKSDKAHHLLRHIRNSIAHAMIKKEKKYYYLKDYNSNMKLSMTAKIRIDLFDSFVFELTNTSK